MHRSNRVQTLTLWAVLAAFACFLSACSPAYVIRAAYEESRILLRRKNIKSVIAEPDTPQPERQKLETVLEAREFAEHAMGLTARESYTKYSRIDRDVLAWIVLGSRPDAFELYTWWFPIVGSVPYKGYFEKEDAESQAASLEKKGYETWVRPTDAFSTLGWFNDPVLSTTLRYDEISITDTVIHEIFHSTIWIENEVGFNESAANFVGGEGARQFFETKLRECDSGPVVCDPAKREALKQRYDESEERGKSELEFANMIGTLYDELDALYKSNETKENKLTKRLEIFDRYVLPIRAKYPHTKLFSKINNAEISQLRLYLTGLHDFHALFEKSGKAWPVFLDNVRKIEEARKKDSDKDPFVLLREMAT